MRAHRGQVGVAEHRGRRAALVSERSPDVRRRGLFRAHRGAISRHARITSTGCRSGRRLAVAGKSGGIARASS
jgi:hypothetical protein